MDFPVQIVNSPVLSSRPVAVPVAAPEAGLVDSHDHGHVMTSQPAQGGVTEHRNRPVPGGAEEGLRSSHVDLVGQDKSNSSTGPSNTGRPECVHRWTDTTTAVSFIV